MIDKNRSSETRRGVKKWSTNPGAVLLLAVFSCMTCLFTLIILISRVCSLGQERVEPLNVLEVPADESHYVATFLIPDHGKKKKKK